VWDTEGVGGEPAEPREEKVMTLVEHLAELRMRVAISVAAVVLGTIVGFMLAPRIIALLLRPLPGGEVQALTLSGPLYLQLRVALVVGIFLALPVVLYEIWAFVAPGLTPRERRAALPWIPLTIIFFVLGAVVAQVSGMSYFDYVRRHIFGPARMTRTDFYTRPEVLARNDIARPYWTQRDGTRADLTASPFFLFCGGPDSGAYSTVHDMLAYARALRSGELLGPAFTDLITSGKVPVEGRRFYAYGFEDAMAHGRRVFGHSGSGPGRAANLDLVPHDGRVAVILSNYDTTIEPIVASSRDIMTG
jgi:hypothetical protein